MNDQQHDGEIVGCMPLPMVGHATSMSAAVDIVVETVIKAVLVLDGTELCTVGFSAKTCSCKATKGSSSQQQVFSHH
jgi:hypothetical protein